MKSPTSKKLRLSGENKVDDETTEKFEIETDLEKKKSAKSELDVKRCIDPKSSDLSHSDDACQPKNEDSKAVSIDGAQATVPPVPSTKGATLKDFGYVFDDEGRLRDVATGSPFQFDVFKGDKSANQRRYERIGDAITNHVYGLLETSTQLRRLRIPVDASADEPTGFVFVSDDFESNPNLAIFIHGSGVVRAGQWARRLIINDCLDSGTQLPFIRRARELGFAVLVLNSNQNRVDDADDTGRGRHKSESIRGSETPEKHGLYVWKTLVSSRLDLRRVLVVAHSFGGVVTIRMAASFPNEWISKVAAVAFTDSVHSELLLRSNERLGQWFAANSINWVTSNEEVDTPLDCSAYVPRVSAGHDRHENTSWAAFGAIFEFFKKKLEMLGKEETESKDSDADASTNPKSD